jgi:hypothetical protein
MSEHAKVIVGEVVALVDLDPAIRAGWIAAGNPKAALYLPVVTLPQPAYDATREALEEVWSIVPATEARRGWNVRAKTADEMRKVWTSLEFLGRFTTAEMAQVETAREHDQIVQSFYRAALAANEIVSDDPRTVAGVNYLSAIGILTLGRVDEVLGR